MSDAPTPPGPPLETLKLVSPIPSWGGVETDEIHFYRRIKAKDLIWLQKGGWSGYEGTVYLMTRLCLVPLKGLDELDGHDLDRADQVIKRFLDGGPKAGKSDSQPSGESSQDSDTTS